MSNVRALSWIWVLCTLCLGTLRMKCSNEGKTSKFWFHDS